jgi:hypothetical protein
VLFRSHSMRGDPKDFKRAANEVLPSGEDLFDELDSRTEKWTRTKDPVLVSLEEIKFAKKNLRKIRSEAVKLCSENIRKRGSGKFDDPPWSSIYKKFGGTKKGKYRGR